MKRYRPDPFPELYRVYKRQHHPAIAAILAHEDARYITSYTITVTSGRQYVPRTHTFDLEAPFAPLVLEIDALSRGVA